MLTQDEIDDWYFDTPIYRPMTGFFASLSEEGKKRVLEYRGPEPVIGDEEFLKRGD